MSVSIVDQIVARILFSPQNNLEICTWFQIPSKPGMGFTHEQTTLLNNYVKKMYQPSSYDVSGWDFSVQEWELQLEAEMRIALAEAQGTLFAQAVENYYYAYCRSVFALSDGSLFAQTIPGIVKSGGYTTSSSNSRIAAMASVMAGATTVMTAGDDHVADTPHDYIERMASLGHTVKVEQSTLDYSFCSHEYSFDGYAYTNNDTKMTYALLSKNASLDERKELYIQWTRDMIHHPDIDAWKETIISSGYLSEDTT